MSDLALAERHRRDQLAIRTSFLRTFVALWRGLSLVDLQGTLDPWLRSVEPVVRAAHDRSAASSARYFREARSASIARRLKAAKDAADARRREAGPVNFEPTLAELETERLRRSLTVATVGTAVKAKRSGLTDLDDRAQVAAARSASRLVLAGGRETLERAIEDDPESVGWIRITDGGPCGFCAMLASRGWVYKSRESALWAEGIEGEAYHDGCGCTVAARFRNDVDSPIPATNQRLGELWYQTGAYFSGVDSLNAFRRAIAAQAAGRDVRAAVFDGPASDPERYRRGLKDQATVDELKRQAARGLLALDDPRRTPSAL